MTDLDERQRRVLLLAIWGLEQGKYEGTADDLRREFRFDLANLKFPTEEEKERIAYASMH